MSVNCVYKRLSLWDSKSILYRLVRGSRADRIFICVVFLSVFLAFSSPISHSSDNKSASTPW